MPWKQMGSVTFIATITEKKHNVDESAETDIRSPAPNEQYAFKVQLEDSQHDLTSILRKAIYLVKISIGVTSNASLTVASVVDTGGNPNSINKNFLLLAWRVYIGSIRSLQLGTATREVVSV